MIGWPAISNQSLLGRLLRLPLKIIPKNTEISIKSGICKGLKWTVGSGNHGYWLGSYELTKQLALERYVKTGMTVFDIGAHAGFYTLFFSRLVGEEGKVFAFEPYHENLTFLVKHVQLNRIKNVTVVASAICKKDRFEGFVIGTSNYTGRVQTDRQTDRHPSTYDKCG